MVEEVKLKESFPHPSKKRRFPKHYYKIHLMGMLNGMCLLSSIILLFVGHYLGALIFAFLFYGSIPPLKEK